MNKISLLDKCLVDNIPIIRKQTANFILSLIDKNKFSSILEVGTAYGYSASLWLQNANIKKIISIEKLESNYLIAKSYLNDPKLTLINCDAFDFDTKEKFDLIFIDGPKSRQELLIKKYLSFLKENGIIINDNLYLNKFSKLESSLLTKNQLKLLNKVNNFRNWLLTNPLDCHFELIDIDDGIGVLRKHAKN